MMKTRLIVKAIIQIAVTEVCIMLANSGLVTDFLSIKMDQHFFSISSDKRPIFLHLTCLNLRDIRFICI